MLFGFGDGAAVRAGPHRVGTGVPGVGTGPTLGSECGGDSMARVTGCFGGRRGSLGKRLNFGTRPSFAQAGAVPAGPGALCRRPRTRSTAGPGRGVRVQV